MEKQKELEQAITDAANAKITALEKKHNDELESIKMEGAKMLLDLTKDSTQKELDLADLEHKERVREIETKFKDETDLKVRLLKQEDEYYQKTRADITREGNQKQLSEQEQLEISTLEIISFYGAKTEVVSFRVLYLMSVLPSTTMCIMYPFRACYVIIFRCSLMPFLSSFR